jgi:small-conductance mechanosensitive channel
MFHLTEPMDIDKLAYLVSFSVPVWLMVVSCTTRKVIEGVPFNRKHFYLGLDLTIYFLTACLINVADLARSHTLIATSYIWTLCLTILAVVILWVQVAFHQEWEKDAKSPTGQIIVLCVASNGVGLTLLFGFVRMKLSGLL